MGATRAAGRGGKPAVSAAASSRLMGLIMQMRKVSSSSSRVIPAEWHQQHQKDAAATLCRSSKDSKTVNRAVIDRQQQNTHALQLRQCLLHLACHAVLLGPCNYLSQTQLLHTPQERQCKVT
jgi:hypothetical protein